MPINPMQRYYRADKYRLDSTTSILYLFHLHKSSKI